MLCILNKINTIYSDFIELIYYTLLKVERIFLLKRKELRLSFFSVILVIAVVGLDNSVASYSHKDLQFFSQQLDELWRSEEKAGKNLFLKRIQERLPAYKPLFMEASQEIDIHWTLLAAISYQESHWDPKAISKTGVRGLMMLTQETAKEMGVTKRTDPHQSVRGGSLYFQKILDRLPDSIPITDKTWMSLAAYNMGFKHIKDSRGLAKEMGKNPNNWNDLNQILALHLNDSNQKNQDEKYQRAKEVVDYVSKIKLFYKTLVLIEEQNTFLQTKT